MRIAALFIAAAILGFVPAIAHADNESSAAYAPPTYANPPAPEPPATLLQGINTDNVSPQARAAIEGIIKNYLTKTNPEVLIDASKELEKREQATAQQKSETAITSNKDKIYNDANTPVGGNPKGDVTIVEFFDYNCGYCKLSEDGVEQVLKNDKGVKFIYKDFPILGPESVVAAHASFAAIKQGKFVPFHDALMNKKDHVSDETIYQAARSAGLDVDKLKKDMTDPAIDKMIEDNIKLGTDIGVRGTPMFIINGQVFPGSMQYEQLKKDVDDARAAAAAKKS